MTQNKGEYITKEHYVFLTTLVNKQGDLYLINEKEVEKLGWILSNDELDDNSIFDEYADDLAKAMNRLGCKNFYVIQADDLFYNPDNTKYYSFPATLDGVEDFQGLLEWQDVLSLFDCLIFGPNLEFVVYRPDTTYYTSYAGPKAFVDMALKTLREREASGYFEEDHSGEEW